MNLSFDPRGFETIDTIAKLQAWDRMMTKATSICTDTETSGLDTMTVSLAGVALAVQEGSDVKAAYIPIGHTTGKQLSWDKVRPVLKKHLEGPKPLILHNALYDFAIFERYGIKLTEVHDTMYMSYTMRGASQRHGMDFLSKKYLNWDTIKYDDVVIPALGHRDFRDVDIPIATQYAAEDCAVTLMLAKVFQRIMVQEGTWSVYDEIDRPLLPVLHEMKMSGVLVNYDRLEELKADWSVQAKKLEAQAHKLAGETFNLASAPDKARILYDVLKLPILKETKGGSPSVDKDVLEMLSDEHEIADVIVEYRRLTTLMSTFCTGLVDARNKITGRVHGNFNATFTNTRRFSSSEPNLQNIPTRTEYGKEIRNAFTAPTGMMLVCGDYSQIEYRMLAHITGQQSMIDAFVAGEDFHTKIATEVLGISADKVTKSIRDTFKNVNFAVIYGAGPKKVARMSKIEEAQAYVILDDYATKYPDVVEWKEAVCQEARCNGFVETLFGGRIYVPLVRSKASKDRSRAERQAVNGVVQGTAADIMRLALHRVQQALKRWHNHGVRMLLTVHDEIVVEAPAEVAEDVREAMQAAMQTAADEYVQWRVPILASVKKGPTWLKAK